MRARRLQGREKSGEGPGEKRSGGHSREGLDRERRLRHWPPLDRSDVRDVRLPATERREAMEKNEPRDRSERRDQEERGPAEGVHQEPCGRSRERAPQREDARE